MGEREESVLEVRGKGQQAIAFQATRALSLTTCQTVICGTHMVLIVEGGGTATERS